MNVALTHSKIERPTPQHRGIARVFALIMTFALMCAGLVAGGTAAQADDDPWGTGVLRGHITMPSGVNIADYRFQTETADGISSISLDVDASGNYESTVLKTNTYRVTAFREDADMNTLGYSVLRLDGGNGATTVNVTEGAAATQANFTVLPMTAHISGTVTNGGFDRTVVSLEEQLDGAWVRHVPNIIDDHSGDAAIDFTSYDLAAGTYRVRYYLEDAEKGPRWQWWDHVGVEADAKLITLSAGQQVTDIDADIDQPLVWTKDPKLTGTAEVGATLTADPGTVSPEPEGVFFTWTSDGNAIMDASGPTYVVRPQDRGHKIGVTVNPWKNTYVTEVRRTNTFDIPLGTLTTATPTISGTPQVGQKLTAKPGTWGPSGVKLAYQWLRDGAAISGATASTYTAVAADQGKKLSVKVSGSATGYTNAAKTSAATAAVTAADPGTPAAPPFTDIAQGDKFYKEIAWMYQSGLTTGVKVGDHREYQPKNSVSREAMAAFLFRMDPESKTYVAPKTSPFADVPTSHQFYREIAWMYDQKISTGVKQPSGKPKYDAKTQVSREAMAAFLFRLDDRGYTTPQTSRFSDIAPGDKFYREMSWMYDANISTGVKQPSGKPAYQPKSSVTREAMAAFLYRID